MFHYLHMVQSIFIKCHVTSAILTRLHIVRACFLIWSCHVTCSLIWSCHVVRHVVCLRRDLFQCLTRRKNKKRKRKKWSVVSVFMDAESKDQIHSCLSAVPFLALPSGIGFALSLSLSLSKSKRTPIIKVRKLVECIVESAQG